MNELVTVIENDTFTTSLELASGTQNKHASVLQLIRQNKSDLEKFGSLTFNLQVSRKDGRGGQKREIAYLNERQATLVMTYLKNTDIVKEFKIRLVSAFYDMAQQIKELKTQILETENKQLSNTINNIISKPNHFTASAVGKMFSISAVRLNDIMFQHGFLRKDRLPIQKHQNDGFFSVAYCEIKHTSGYIEEKPFTKYTEKGVRLVFDTLKKEGIVEEGFRLPNVI